MGRQLFSEWYQMILDVFRCFQLFVDYFKWRYGIQWCPATGWSPAIRWSQLFVDPQLFNDPQLFDDPHLFDDQLELWTLIIQNSTVIPPSPMVLFLTEHHQSQQWANQYLLGHNRVKCFWSGIFLDSSGCLFVSQAAFLLCSWAKLMLGWCSREYSSTVPIEHIIQIRQSLQLFKLSFQLELLQFSPDILQTPIDTNRLWLHKCW